MYLTLEYNVGGIAVPDDSLQLYSPCVRPFVQHECHQLALSESLGCPAQRGQSGSQRFPKATAFAFLKENYPLSQELRRVPGCHRMEFGIRRVPGSRGWSCLRRNPDNEDFATCFHSADPILFLFLFGQGKEAATIAITITQNHER